MSEESSGEVRYVGQTAHPDARLISHYNVDKLVSTNPKRIWIEDLISRDGRLAMSVVEECHVSEAAEREQAWIEHYSAEGCVLTNSMKAAHSRLYYGNEPVKKPTNFRLPKRTIEMMDEICSREDIDSRAVLVERLVHNYYHFGPIVKRLEALEERVGVLEAKQ